MKLKLKVVKDNASLYEGVYPVSDSKSFGDACSDVWVKLLDRKFSKASSIGALYEALDDSIAADLSGAQIQLQKLNS